MGFRWKSSPFLTPHAVESLLASLSAAPSPSVAAQVHPQLLTRSLLAPHSRSGYFSTKLLQLYADAGDLLSALKLFDALPHKNIFAYTAIIAYLSRSGDHRRCLSSYSLMRAAGVFPDGYVLPVTLRSAHSTLFVAAALHADAVKFAAADNLHVGNALINAYTNSGDIASARVVFDSMDGRDVLSWNSIISAYVSIGSTDSALALLRTMESDGFQANTVTWNTIIDGYCRDGRCEEACEIFDRMVDPNVVTYTTIILGYAQSGNHGAALGLFRRMASDAAVPPDQDTLSCVVACCRHVADVRAGREVHACGLKAMEPAEFYFSAGAALVALYAGGKCIRAAKRVFDRIDRTDPINWNAVITGLTHAGEESDALDHFREMHSRGIGIDSTTLASVLPACSLTQGQQIHAHALRKYYDPDTEVQNALISTYARSGCITAARLVFSSAISAGDVVTWNAMISAYGSHGLGGSALELAGVMDRAGPRPNSVTFTIILAACSHAGLVDEGLEWFERFRNVMGRAPGMQQYACVVDMLGRAGRFEEAVGFIRRMVAMPAASVWGALMAASRAHQNVEIGRLAFEELVRIEPDNAGNYVAMAELYARAGRWEEAKMVRRIIDERCVVKPSGYSWVVME